jgi:hypothetical protein
MVVSGWRLDLRLKRLKIVAQTFRCTTLRRRGRCGRTECVAAAILGALAARLGRPTVPSTVVAMLVG